MTQKKKSASPSCASCTAAFHEKACMTDSGRESYKGCPSITQKDILAEANREYLSEKTRYFAQKASIQEAECYANRDEMPYIMQPTKTRIMETCEFALKMEYKTLGLAFCLGLANEARVVEEILKSYGFDVVSLCCKAGKTSKDLIGLTDDEKVFKGTDESMCNPIFQARLLTHENVDFNILLGLCVGHDTLFFQHTDTPTTVLAVKDRVTGHNPLAPVYNAGTYYKKLQHPKI